MISVSRSIFLLFGLILIVGCKNGFDFREYSSSEELMQSSDASWIAYEQAIPAGSFDIEVRSDAETGLVLISYVIPEKTGGGESSGMARLPTAFYSDVLGRLGFTRPNPDRIYYKCNSTKISFGDVEHDSHEIIFTGYSDNVGYYWNSLGGRIFNLLCPVK